MNPQVVLDASRWKVAPSGAVDLEESASPELRSALVAMGCRWSIHVRPYGGMRTHGIGMPFQAVSGEKPRAPSFLAVYAIDAYTPMEYGRPP